MVQKIIRHFRSPPRPVMRIYHTTIDNTWEIEIRHGEWWVIPAKSFAINDLAIFRSKEEALIGLKGFDIKNTYNYIGIIEENTL